MTTLRLMNIQYGRRLKQKSGIVSDLVGTQIVGFLAQAHKSYHILLCYASLCALVVRHLVWKSSPHMSLKSLALVLPK